MALGDEVLKEGFGKLPAGARHAISLAAWGGLMVLFFFLFIREPLAEAASADSRQDATQTRQQAAIDRMADAITALTQAQAVQSSGLATLQRDRDRQDQSLNRIEDKIDRLRQGR